MTSSMGMATFQKGKGKVTRLSRHLPAGAASFRRGALHSCTCFHAAWHRRAPGPPRGVPRGQKRLGKRDGTMRRPGRRGDGAGTPRRLNSLPTGGDPPSAGGKLSCCDLWWKEKDVVHAALKQRVLILTSNICVQPPRARVSCSGPGRVSWGSPRVGTMHYDTQWQCQGHGARLPRDILHVMPSLFFSIWCKDSISHIKQTREGKRQ